MLLQYPWGSETGYDLLSQNATLVSSIQLIMLTMFSEKMINSYSNKEALMGNSVSYSSVEEQTVPHTVHFWQNMQQCKSCIRIQKRELTSHPFLSHLIYITAIKFSGKKCLKIELRLREQINNIGENTKSYSKKKYKLKIAKKMLTLLLGHDTIALR